MFSYYGSKTGKESCYPKPIYDKIIEPFDNLQLSIF